MTKQEALQQLITMAPAFFVNKTTPLRIYLDWQSITVIRGGETVEIDPQELFDALKSQK